MSIENITISTTELIDIDNIELKRYYKDNNQTNSKLNKFKKLINKHNIKFIVTDINESIDNKRIISQYIRTFTGERRIEADFSLLDSPRLIDTLYHEYGHYIWFDIISEEEKDQWKDIISTRGSLNEYGSTNTEEDWSEYFTTFFKDKEAFQIERYCEYSLKYKNEERILKAKRLVMENILTNYEIEIHDYKYYKNRCKI